MGVYEIDIAQGALDALSILCSLLTIVLVFWVWKKYPSSKESPSFCLTLWIAVADIPLRIVDLFSIDILLPDGFPRNQAFARFFLWLNVFGALWFVYLTGMISLDLQLVFFHRLPRQARIRRWYPLVGFIIAFLASIPLLCIPKVGIAEAGQIVLGGASLSTIRGIVMWGAIAMQIGIVYSLAVVTSVFVKILSARSKLRQLSDKGFSKDMGRSLIRNVYLIIAYPVVLFIIYIPYSVDSWFVDLLEGPLAIRWHWVATLLFSSQGIFSFLIMLFHPVMLHYYHLRDFSLRTLWSHHVRWLKYVGGTMYSSKFSFSTGTTQPTEPKYSVSRHTKINEPMGDKQTVPPQLNTMDMGARATGLFDSVFGKDTVQDTTNTKCSSGIVSMEVLESGDSENGEMGILPYHTFEGPTCM
ncbi:hypothetical protein IWQ61_004779 [Dispira simplex]|nr:hypothetical protein IWQ61_004779 [Dispira simplex]